MFTFKIRYFIEQNATDEPLTGDSEGGFEDEKCDGGKDQNRQMFYFVDTLPSASLFVGNPAEPLYSVKVSVLCW